MNEVSLAGGLLRYLPMLRRSVETNSLNKWLNRLHGWAEVDSLCQSKFTASDILSHWTKWKHLLTRLCSDDNVSKKRASLVLLTKPVKESDDKRLEDLAFINIDRLKGERDILITKAISWLLRNLIKVDREWKAI